MPEQGEGIVQTTNAGRRRRKPQMARKSVGPQGLWGFKSPRPHQEIPREAVFLSSPLRLMEKRNLCRRQRCPGSAFRQTPEPPRRLSRCVGSEQHCAQFSVPYGHIFDFAAYWHLRMNRETVKCAAYASISASTSPERTCFRIWHMVIIMPKLHSQCAAD